MPGTSEEIMDTARRLATEEIAPDMMPEIWWADGTAITPSEWAHLFGIARNIRWSETTFMARSQRRAIRLLRRHLSPEQRRRDRSSLNFYVQAASGRTYELTPRTGRVWEVVPRGKRWVRIQSFCLHDYAETPETWKERMPPADLSLAHLLLISCDEEAFLKEANATLCEPHDWPDRWDQTSDAAGRIEQVIHDHRVRKREEREMMHRLREGEIDMREDLCEAILAIVGRNREQEEALVG